MKRVDSPSALLGDIWWVAAWFLLSSCLAWQGWRSIPPFDEAIPDFLGASAFLQTGTFPSRGNIGSYNSINPPGAAWLVLPGMMVFSDYRLFELCGSLLLHLGTLVGLFLLGSLAFRRSTARMAVLLYAFSPIGLFFAGSLWQRGLPFFFVWFVLFTVFWRIRGNGLYLAAALITFAAVMNMYMAIAPMVLLLPVVWYLYRPPVGVKWLLAAAVASVLIWLPYLHVEQTRGFRDLASMVLQLDIMPPDHARLLCDPDLREAMLRQPPPAPAGRVMDHVASLVRNRPPGVLTSGLLATGRLVSRAAHSVRERPHAAMTGLLANFTLTQGDRGTDSPIFWLRAPFLLFLTLLVLMRFAPSWLLLGGDPSEIDRPRFLSACGLLGLSAVLFTAIFIRHPPHEWDSLESGLPVQRGAALPATLALLAGVYQWRRSRPVATEDRALNDAGMVCILALVLPWVTLLLISEPLLRRYFLLWPLHVVLLALLASDTTTYWKRASILRAAQIALVLVVVTDSSLYAKLADWKKNGWAGADSDSLQALDFLAGQLRRERTSRAAIGYSYPPAWDDAYQSIDPRYRMGMEFDYVLGQRFGIRNSNHCPEGISAADEYRLFRVGPDPDPPEYVRARRRGLSDFRELARFGEFAVLRRRAPEDGR
jgi:hypothetical protein